MRDRPFFALASSTPSSTARALALGALLAAGCGCLSFAGARSPGVVATATPASPSVAREATGYPLAQPTERPGLATAWGETRLSPVRDAPFERADEERPFSIATLHYDDRAGVDALLSRELARGARFDRSVAVSGGLTLSVVDEQGAPLEAIAAGGRIYVVGKVGRRYSVVLDNLGERRYEAVVSVDGLDVMDGRRGDLSKRGYVIGSHGHLVVDGFRTSESEVAAFRFGPVGASYAARTGSDLDVGVIGVALFAEKGDAPLVAAAPGDADGELRRRLDASPFARAPR